MGERQANAGGKANETPGPTKDQRRAGERARLIVARVGHIIDYLFFVLYGLIALRFLLAFLGASEQAGFVRFIHGVTEPFYAPFSGIVESPTSNGGELDFPALIALAAYVLLHTAVRGLLRVLSGRRVFA